MIELTNVIFLGCNYNDKKIKNQFDNLKRRLEDTTPLSCVIVDKRKGKAAKDIWKDIKILIEQSSACVFDLTGFRPNVVLELGYALSIKAEGKIFITFRKRKSKGKVPQWLLTDISHLNRQEYIHIRDLEDYIRNQLNGTPYMKDYEGFKNDSEQTNAPDRYQTKGLEVIQSIRDEGPKSDQQVKDIMAGTACRFNKMKELLVKNNLLIRGKGHGKFNIPTNKK